MNVPFELTGSLELLWRATWQAVLLATFVWFAIVVFRRWLTPRWRTLLWTIPLLRFCLLILPATSVSLYGLIALPNESNAPSPAQSIALSEAPQFPADRVLHPSASFVDPVEPAFPEKEFVASKPLPDVTTASVDGWKFSTSEVLKFVWAAGAVIFVVHWWLSRFLLQRMLTRCRPLTDPELTAWIGQQSHAADRRRRIRCLVTDEDVGPACCGLWRPVVILPQPLLTELTGEEAKIIIRHEIAHIQRWDAAFLLLSRVATVIHWFNPLVYVIRRQLRREMELAVDAASIRGLADQSRRAYGELLLKLSQRPAGRHGLIEMANSRSAVGKRIDQLSAPPRETRLSAVFAIGLIALLTVSGLSETAFTQEDAPTATAKQANGRQETNPETANNAKPVKRCFVEGTVRDATNQAPVEGAEIRILVATEPDPNKKIRKGFTNENGKYRIEVPLGHVRLWMPALKPGYWLKPEDTMTPLTTSPDRPVVSHDLVARRGPVWQVKVKGNLRDPIYRNIGVDEVVDDAKRAAMLKNEPVTFQKLYPASKSTVDERGNGQLTEAGTSRKLVLRASTERAELIAEPEFDNTQVVSAEKLENSGLTELIDRKGRKATIRNAAVTIEDGIPLLTFEAQIPETDILQKLTGIIVSENARPLSDVKVGVALGLRNGGSAVQGESVQTDHQGRFTLELPMSSTLSPKLGEYQVSLVLTRRGYAGTDTGYYPLSADGQPIDVGTIEMQPGYSLPVKVLDDRGKPAAGAVVEPSGSYALRMQVVRTDEQGRAVLSSLPAGSVSVRAQHGNLYQNSNLVVSADPDDNHEVTIRLEQLPTTAQPAKKPTRLPLGTKAPELTVAEWSDGKQRTLADYRGKVVVLEFWATWCLPCIDSVPLFQKLADKYENKGVVFLGIHPAGTEMAQINKLRKIKQWETPTAIDGGTGNNDENTCRAYGIKSIPAVLILDREGKIAFNSEIEPDDLEAFQAEVAKFAGIPWPPSEDLSEEEQVTQTALLYYALFSREIERALSSQK